MDDREHTIETRLREVEQVMGRLEERLVAMAKAVELASVALTIRLEHSNGLIAQMKEREKEVARVEHVEAVEARVAALERHDEEEGGRRKGGQVLRDIGMLIVGAAIAYAASKF